MAEAVDNVQRVGSVQLVHWSAVSGPVSWSWTLCRWTVQVRLYLTVNPSRLTSVFESTTAARKDVH